MASAEMPVTKVACDAPGCKEELNLLAPHLVIQVKAQREVMLMDEVESADPNEVAVPDIRLGTKSGRGRIMRIHGFDCLLKYAEKMKGKEAKLEFHSEEDIYEPDDNRAPEELVKAGELPKEVLALHKAQEDFTPKSAATSVERRGG